MPDLRDRTERELELAALLLLGFHEYEDDWPNLDWAAFQADLEAAQDMPILITDDAQV
jgi:hypothetical protein